MRVMDGVLNDIPKSMLNDFPAAAGTGVRTFFRPATGADIVRAFL
jgi:hypothetical protein